MAKYAEIYVSDNRVHVIFDADKVPVGNPAVVIYVDVTADLPLPQPGWLYDTATKTFTASSFPLPAADADAAAVKTLLAKASATFTTSDLADTLKKIAKRLYGL